LTDIIEREIIDNIPKKQVPITLLSKKEIKNLVILNPNKIPDIIDIIVLIIRKLSYCGG